MNQVEWVTLDSLVPSEHVYRKIDALFPRELVLQGLNDLEQGKGADGYGIMRLFKCLFLQFLEDLSDRELERFLQENTCAKWFCGFGLCDSTPSFTLFGKVRNRIGTSRLSKLFSAIRDALKAQGYMSEVFSFVDASHLIAKASLWKERDKAIADKVSKLNNESLPDVAYDKEARIGCKGKNKFWYGFKKHVSVDMKHGLINKVAITPANASDGSGFKRVCPDAGAVYADKGYCARSLTQQALAKGVHLRAIKKNNQKDKNRDFDRYVTRVRSPFESVFSKCNKRTRYRGVVKNQFTAFMEAIVHNLKRLVVIGV